MKTQVIQLDQHDDIVSVQDRLGWGRAGRIVLIWPERGHILQRQLDMVLLKRFALQHGMQIGLVTKDIQVIEHAQEAEIPVFASTLEAQQGRWRGRRRRQPALWKFRRNRKNSPPVPRKPPVLQATTPPQKYSRILRASLFAASLLAVLASLCTLLPGASITVQRPESEQQMTDTLRASRQAATGQFTIETTSIVVEARGSLATTGEVIVPEKTARGSVQFSNLTEEEVVIPAGTIVTTSEEPIIRFTTVSEGKAPAGYGRTTIVSIIAVDPGARGNLPAGRLQSIEGTLGLFLTARNLSATSGGSDRNTAGPSQADRERLLARMLTDLEAQARKEILSRWETNPSSNDFPFIETLQLDEILEEVYTPAEDWPSSELELKLQVSFRADAVAGSQILRYFETALDSQLAADQEPVNAVPALELVRPPAAVQAAAADGSGVWEWEMRASRPVNTAIHEEQVRAASRMLPASQTSRILQSTFKLEGAPQVQIWPEWWPFLPVTIARITVLVTP